MPRPIAPAYCPTRLPRPIAPIAQCPIPIPTLNQVSHHISAYEMLFHDNAATRLSAWRKMLLFYGATRAADTLTLARLHHFID